MKPFRLMLLPIWPPSAPPSVMPGTLRSASAERSRALRLQQRLVDDGDRLRHVMQVGRQLADRAVAAREVVVAARPLRRRAPAWWSGCRWRRRTALRRAVRSWPPAPTRPGWPTVQQAPRRAACGAWEKETGDRASCSGRPRSGWSMNGVGNVNTNDSHYAK